MHKKATTTYRQQIEAALAAGYEEIYSQKCHGHWASKNIRTFKCDGCGKLITKKICPKSKHNYCSRTCYFKLIGEKRTRSVFKCDLCGKNTNKTQSSVGHKTHFCNMQCYLKYRKIHGEGHNAVCSMCGAITYKKCKTKINSFCNNECLQKWYRTKWIIFTCDFCGKLRSRKHYRQRYVRNYCSNECQYKYLRSIGKCYCIVCGKEFHATIRNRLLWGRKCCSDKCMRASRTREFKEKLKPKITSWVVTTPEEFSSRLSKATDR